MTFITTFEHIKKRRHENVAERANRLHIKPGFFDVNCPDQLGPGPCVDPHAFMDGFRLARRVLQPTADISSKLNLIFF